LVPQWDFRDRIVDVNCISIMQYKSTYTLFTVATEIFISIIRVLVILYSSIYVSFPDYEQPS